MISYLKLYKSLLVVSILLSSMSAHATLLRYSGDLSVADTGPFPEFSSDDTFSFQFDIDDSNIGFSTRLDLLTNIKLTKTGGSGSWSPSGGSFADGTLRVQNNSVQLWSNASGFSTAGGMELGLFGISLDGPIDPNPISNANTEQSLADMFSGAFDMNDFSSRTAQFYFGSSPFGVSVNMDLSNLTSSSVSAVPVPAAVWLMGSALLGLVGMRKKKV